jgi:hypothetical protein
MKFYMAALLITAAIHANAEDVFYNENVRVASVDCAKGELVTVADHHTYPVRTVFASKPNMPKIMCQKLSAFAGKDNALTLLTVPTQKQGDLIENQEVIGFVDVDYVVAAWEYSKVNKVFRDLCGNANRSSNVCIWTADDKNKFVSFNSIYGTNIFSAKQDATGLKVEDTSAGQPTVYHLEVTPHGTDGKSFVGVLEISGEQNDPPFKLNNPHDAERASGPRL